MEETTQLTRPTPAEEAEQQPVHVLDSGAPIPAPPPSSSALSEPPESGDKDTRPGAPEETISGLELLENTRPLEQAENAVNSVNANATGAASTSIAGWEAAKDQVAHGTAPTINPPMPAARGISTPRRGRPPKRAGVGSVAGGGHDPSAVKTEDGVSQSTPGSSGRGRGRGRGGGRPRGRARGSTARGGKRKREDDDDGASDSSDEVTPIATMTKSGRSIQKPTSFVPPPQSPTTTHKRKRPYNRRNPESAVCRACLRGNSPASNMIVFCDGCNTPYHRWCHHPPIDQAVIDETDKEWFCHECESERVVPVPVAEVERFVSAEGASADERQAYFSTLPPGMLITLLTKATTLKPDLPLFPPKFKAQLQQTASASTNGHASSSMAPPAPPPHHGISRPPPDEEEYDEDVHPPNYPRPGQGLLSTLPPEQEDLQWLVENDDKHGVFTHIYQDDKTIQKAVATGSVGDVAGT
ncbi:SWM histone demethylase complex subunit phf1 [Lecanosticta acicola]|uniref:SWM histone demethylase complex subunit phf1 n=1 Tax=Lecanosticta acicola TaxID=111012 RepID=A0AAI8Z131_9PEZI|nr:SWM histone demethylase complex subunit phf1 [Lecanosticta acicola]